MRKKAIIGLTLGLCAATMLCACGTEDNYNRRSHSSKSALIKAGKKNKKNKAKNKREETGLEEEQLADSYPNEAVEGNTQVIEEDTIANAPVVQNQTTNTKEQTQVQQKVETTNTEAPRTEAPKVETTKKPESTATKEPEHKKEDTQIASKEEVDFDEMMECIYGAAPGAAGSGEKMVAAAEMLKEFAFTYAENSSASTFSNMAREWLDNKKAEIPDIDSIFGECMNSVTNYGMSQNEELQYDVSYMKVVNGINNEMKSYSGF